MMTKLRPIPITVMQRLRDLLTMQQYPTNMLQDMGKLLTRCYLSPLKELMSSSDSIFASLKWLMIIHHIIRFEKVERVAQIQKLLKELKPKNKKRQPGFQGILLQKLIEPYKKYLVRRAMHTEVDVDQEIYPFVLINLINKALSFTQVLFMMGRYLWKTHKFLNEFNIVLAKDLSELYRQLKTKMSYQFRMENAQILQTLHESYYLIYYNCYFNKYVSAYAPSWINTDQLIEEQQSIYKNKRRNSELASFGSIDKYNWDEENSHNLSICVDNHHESSSGDLIKTASTIATKNFIKQENMSDKEIKQRLDFIATASQLLTQFQDSQNCILSPKVNQIFLAFK